MPRAPDPEELVFYGEDVQAGPIFEKDITGSTEVGKKDEIEKIDVDKKDEDKDAEKINVDKNEETVANIPEIVTNNDSNIINDNI